MNDWAKKLFSEPHTLGIILSSGVLGLIAGVYQGIVQKRHGGWGGFFSALVSGVVVSVLVGLAIEGWVPSETLRLAIIGAAAVVSEDMLAGLKTVAKAFGGDPVGVVFRVLDAMRGRTPTPRIPTGTTRPATLEGDR